MGLRISTTATGTGNRAFRFVEDNSEAVISYLAVANRVSVYRGSTRFNATVTASAAQAGNGTFTFTVPTGSSVADLVVGDWTATVNGESVTISANPTISTTTLTVQLTAGDVNTGDTINITGFYHQGTTFRTQLVASSDFNPKLFFLQQNDILIVGASATVNIEDPFRGVQTVNTSTGNKTTNTTSGF